MTIKDMQARAALNGGKCLSKEYINIVTKLLWKCKKGHIWETTPAIIVQGSWCPVCNKLKSKYTIKDMQEWAAEKRGKCLSKKYINMNTRLKWRCHKRHIWETTPQIIYKGHWCPHCAKMHPFTIEDVHRMAAAKRGKCLSEKYKNTKSVFKWQCEKGHRWKTRVHNVRNGCWCPECAGRKKGTLAEMRKIAKKRQGKCLSEIYIDGQTKMEWQCSKGHRWKAAGGSVKSGKWCAYCAGVKRKTIEDMRQLATERGIKCLSDKYINCKTKLLWQCPQGHKWEAVQESIIKAKSCCPVCSGRQKKNIEDMHLLASLRGGKCLSKKYINTDTKLRWQCSKGHIWKTVPHGIAAGKWCPHCYRNKRRKSEKT